MTNKKQSKKGTIIVAIIVFLITLYASKSLFKNNLESELKNAAMELNKQTPIKIDQFTRLDSVTTIGETNFMYYYTLTEIKKSEINLDTINKYIRPTIIENVKKNPDLKTYRDNHITLDYKYYDKNGIYTTEISVTPELYKTE